MRGIVGFLVVLALLVSGLMGFVSRSDSDVSSAPTTNSSLLQLGPVELLAGAYGCNNAAAVADVTKTGASNDPICHFDNFSIPEATVQCTTDGGTLLGNESAGALSDANASVSHDGTYLNITLQPGVTLLWSFIKGSTNHNHYTTDLVGLHSPINGGNNTPVEISHWGLCYIPVSPV